MRERIPAVVVSTTHKGYPSLQVTNEAGLSLGWVRVKQQPDVRRAIQADHVVLFSRLPHVQRKYTTAGGPIIEVYHVDAE